MSMGGYRRMQWGHENAGGHGSEAIGVGSRRLRELVSGDQRCGGALFSDKSEIPYMYGDGSKPIIPILLE